MIATGRVRQMILRHYRLIRLLDFVAELVYFLLAFIARCNIRNGPSNGLRVTSQTHYLVS
ncbi:hypothetical protein V1478_002780 [Vespula squamosa]|uniref:Uncharacterized protein n=1 Tax=Vespula squamosa TaxID=30214 RepID=A0ABD2BSC6_VESSQ